jgi:hypothetical protein
VPTSSLYVMTRCNLEREKPFNLLSAVACHNSP